MCYAWAAALCNSPPPAQRHTLPPPAHSSTPQVGEGEHALQAAAAEASAVTQELEEARSGLAERQVVLDSAHAAVVEKERRIANLEMDLRQQQAAVAVVEQRLAGG